MSEILSLLGSIHDQNGDFQNALLCFDEALDVEQDLYGVNDIKLDEAINNIGVTYKKLGNFEEARIQFERLLDIRTAKHGENHQDVANACSSIGIVLKKLEEYEKSKTYFLQALNIRKKVYVNLHGDHEDVAKSLTDLALLYEAMNEIDLSLDHHEQALRIRRSVFGDDHLLVAETLNNIGLTYKKANDLVKAKYHFEEALQIRLLYGSDTPNVKTTRNLIASVINLTSRATSNVNEVQKRSSGQYFVADGKQQHLHLKVSGQEHLSLALSLRSVALSLVQTGQQEEAAPLLEQSLHLIKMAYDDKSPILTPSTSVTFFNGSGGSNVKSDQRNALVVKNDEIARASTCLARVIRLQCKYDVAAGLYLSAHVILCEVYSSKDSRVLENLLELASVYASQESFDKAKQVLDECLSLTQHIYGEENEAIASVLSEIAYVCKLKGDFNASKRLYEKALGIRMKALGDSHPLVALSLSDIGMLMQSMKKYEDSMALHKQALSIRLEAFQSEMHTEIGMTYRAIAAVHVECLRWLDAKDALEKAAHILRSTTGEDGILLGGTLIELAIVASLCNFSGHNALADNGKLHNLLDSQVKRIVQERHKSEITIQTMSRLLRQKCLKFRANDLDSLMPLLEKAADIYIKSYGKLHPDTAHAFSELGIVLQQYPKECVNERCLAVLSLQEAYTTRQRLYGDVKNHPHVISSLCDLNELLLEEGLWERAFVTATELLAIRQDIVSGSSTEKGKEKKHSSYREGDNPDIVHSLLQIALVLLRLNDINAARERCSECVEMSIRVFGPESVETSCALTLLGEIRLSQGKPNKAKSAHEEALAIRKKLCDDEASRSVKHVDSGTISGAEDMNGDGDFTILHGTLMKKTTLLAESYEALADLRLRSSKLEKTNELYSLALTTRREANDQQPDIMMSHILSDTADLLCLQERYIEAKAIALENLRVRRVVCRFEKAPISDSLIQLAMINVSMEEFEEALLFLEEALTIRKECFSKCSVEVADIYHKMAMVFAEANDTAEARNLLNSALNIHKQRVRLERMSKSPSLASASRTAGFDDSEEIIKTLDEIAMLYFRTNDFPSAIPLFEEAIAMSLRLGGLESAPLPPILLKLAFSLKKTGKLVDSRQKYEQAVAILTQLHSKVNGIHLDVATAVSSLSSLCFYEGKFDEALNFSKKALHIRKTILGPYHEDVMSTLWNQASICEKLGQFNDALGKVMIVYNWRKRRMGIDLESQLDNEDELDKNIAEGLITINVMQEHVQCLVLIAELQRKVGQYSASMTFNSHAERLLLRIKCGDKSATSASDDQDVLERRAFMADVCKLQANFEEAESIMRDVVSRSVHSQGVKSVATALHMYNLATILNKRGGHFAEAYDLFKSALATQTSLLGYVSVTVANTLNNLGVLLLTENRYGEAEDRFNQSLSIRKQVHGELHPDVAASLNNLAGLYDMRNDFDEAQHLYEEALHIRVKLFSKTHPAVAQSMNNLAQLQVSIGDYPRAQKLFRKTLRILKAFYGPDHLDVASCSNNLAGSLENSTDRDQQLEALELYQEALRIRQEVLGTVHPSTAQSLNNLATLYYRLGQYEQSIKLFKKSIDVKTQLYGDESTDIAESRNNIAMLYMAAGTLVSAVHSQEVAVELMEKLLGSENPRTVNVKGNLGIIYRRMGSFDRGNKLVLNAKQYFEKNDFPSNHPWLLKFAAEEIDTPSESKNIMSITLDDDSEDDIQSETERSLEAAQSKSDTVAANQVESDLPKKRAHRFSSLDGMLTSVSSKSLGSNGGGNSKERTPELKGEINAQAETPVQHKSRGHTIQDASYGKEDNTTTPPDHGISDQRIGTSQRYLIICMHHDMYTTSS